MEIIFEPVTLQETLSSLLITIMIVIACVKTYELGIMQGKLDLRREQLAKSVAELKKLRGE